MNFHCLCNRDKAVKCITENYVTLMHVTLVRGHHRGVVLIKVSAG